jgi:8-hydroxy-5-deazaflavin:NADPH oxidoreductase
LSRERAAQTTKEVDMNVGILGAGDVAKALGAGFLKYQHAVALGTRTPAKLDAWAREHPQARIAGFAEIAKTAELLVLAVKGAAAAEALRAAGAANLAGKVVIDATNPIAEAPRSTAC